MIVHVAMLGAALFQARATDSLTLDAALARAHQLRGDTRVAAATVSEARAQHSIAGQVSNPVGSYQYTGDTPRQHATVSQSFDWWLVRGANRAAASAGIARAVADSTLTVADIAADVRLAFFEALAAQQAYDLALRLEAHRRLPEPHRRAPLRERRHLALRGRPGATGSSPGGAARSRVRVSHSPWHGPSLPAASHGPGSSTELNPAGALDEGLGSDAEPPADIAALPFVQAAVADSTIADYRRQSAGRARIPLPALEAGADWDDPTNPGRTYFVFGVAIPLPIWNQGGAGLDVARAQSEQAAGLAQEARLEGARRVAEATTRRREAATRARIARDSLLPSATRLRERATAAYRAGETGVVPVLDALRSEREIALGAILDLLAYQDAVTEWNRLLGVEQ